MACDCGLLAINDELLWGMVASSFGLLGLAVRRPGLGDASSEWSGECSLACGLVGRRLHHAEEQRGSD